MGARQRGAIPARSAMKPEGPPTSISPSPVVVVVFVVCFFSEEKKLRAIFPQERFQMNQELLGV